MSKFESICDVMKSDGGPVIAGVGTITVLVGGYYLTKRGYKCEVKKGETTITVAPASPTPAEPEAEANEPAAEKNKKAAAPGLITLMPPLSVKPYSRFAKIVILLTRFRKIVKSLTRLPLKQYNHSLA